MSLSVNSPIVTNDDGKNSEVVPKQYIEGCNLLIHVVLQNYLIQGMGQINLVTLWDDVGDE
jgi:hypothetical protein